MADRDNVQCVQKHAEKQEPKKSEVHQLHSEADIDTTFGMVLSLPEMYKLTIYLFYYEGYSDKDIGGMLGKRQSTVWKYLKTGRNMLRELIKEEML